MSASLLYGAAAGPDSNPGSHCALHHTPVDRTGDGGVQPCSLQLPQKIQAFMSLFNKAESVITPLLYWLLLN